MIGLSNYLSIYIVINLRKKLKVREKTQKYILKFIEKALTFWMILIN